MPRCEVCGNDYAGSFEVIVGADHHIFDSFECAIQALAPVCAHCGCKVIGHGVESVGIIYCCNSCMRQGSAMHAKRAGSSAAIRT